jgi:penicillin-binding protein A
MERRIRRVGIFMVLCFVALFVQLNNIQVLKANSLATDSNNPRVLAANRDQPRGSILSADGVTLASSVPTPDNVVKYKRVYNPDTAQLFSHITGFDSPNYSLTGIELEYNNFLKSHTRPARTLGDLLVNRTTTDNVTLTISTTLQSQVAQILDGVQQTDKAPVEAAVVVDPKTGAVEAMYSNPTFDPNPLASPDGATEKSYWDSLDPDSGQSPLVSNAFQNPIAPGSTFKVVTTSAVFDHQPSLATYDYPQAGCITLPQGGLQFCNYHKESCGGTLTTTLPQSCNTAFGQMGMSLGATALTTEAQSFGFNQRIPIDLPGVTTSQFPPDTPGGTTTLYNNAPGQAYSAIGQENVNATALQMALVAAGIANNGVIMTPHVMSQIRDSQGNLVQSYTPHKWLTATSPETAQQVTSLMQLVATQGTAAGYFPPSWNVAAKTGTAETGSTNQYTNDWMVAFAPANDPKVAVAVVVPNQPADATGATVSAPPTKAILGAALGLGS